MKRQLIINADDFGYTRGINRAIARCRAEGALCSTTLMANGEAFVDAVNVAGSCQGLGVGVHLVLTELSPCSMPGEIPGLVDENGFLPATPAKLAGLILRGKVKAECIQKELDLQVARVFDSGIAPTHLDSHKHVHAIPQVLEAAIEVAGKYGIRWIRNPFDETSGLQLTQVMEKESRPVFFKQYIKARALRIVRPAFFKRLRRSGLCAPDHFFGTSLTGLWNEAAVERLVERLPPGITEWMFHPGFYDEQLRQRPTRLGTQREKELELLIFPHLIELLNRCNVSLSCYRDQFI